MFDIVQTDPWTSRIVRPNVESNAAFGSSNRNALYLRRGDSVEATVGPNGTGGSVDDSGALQWRARRTCRANARSGP
jgi:hypothetical protein